MEILGFNIDLSFIVGEKHADGTAVMQTQMFW